MVAFNLKVKVVHGSSSVVMQTIPQKLELCMFNAEVHILRYWHNMEYELQYRKCTAV